MVRIITAADGHYGGQFESGQWPEYGVPDETRHETMINWINQEVAENGVDFVVFNGDNWHDFPYTEIPAGYPGAGTTYMDRAIYWYDQLDCPYFCTHGNHDRLSFQAWENFFGYPVNHHFAHKGYGIVLLNTGSNEGEDVGYGTGYALPDLQFVQDTYQHYFEQEMPMIIFNHVDWTFSNYGGGGLMSATFGDNWPLHHFVRLRPHIIAVHWGHRHIYRSTYLYGRQLYAFSGHFSHRTNLDYGYRVIELEDRSYVI